MSARWLVLLGLFVALPVFAGQECEQEWASAPAQAAAAEQALDVAAALDEVDAPAALLARVSLDTGIVWVDDASSARLAAMVADHSAARLFDADYNVIARPRSRRFQNCTGFALELLALAAYDGGGGERDAAQRLAASSGFVPHRLHIPYSRRIVGGLFGRNAHFTDHPVRARLAGSYDVVSVESIFDWLARNGRIVRRVDWRRARTEVRRSPA